MLLFDSFFVVFLTTGFANAFVVHHQKQYKPSHHQRRSILAGYRNEWGGGGGAGNQDAAGNRDDVQNKRRRQHVPLLSPIPGAPPLLLGGELLLDPPTPMQWQTLQESVLLHQEYLKEQNEINDDNTPKTTGVDAAPLVAVIDDVTGKDASGKTRYATLAAVVGISSSSTNTPGLDMTDESSFMESLVSVGGTLQSPLYSRIRLVGVGRATLNEFFYKAQSEEDDDDDELGMAVGGVAYDDRYGGGNAVLEDEIDDEEEPADPPIVMAEFTVIRDSPISSTASANQLGKKGARSVHCSPVHALAEMSTVVNRVIYLHDARRRLVEGLKAAKVRLEQANMFDDHDGIGEVTSKDENEQALIEELLSKYNHGDVLPLDTSTVASMDNYGLNYYSSFSSIPQLTNVALQTFEPYYSPEEREREEYEMEITSFVSFRALDRFCSPKDMSWALQCTNTAERLNAAYDLISRHKELLENMAEYTTRDLRDCGEECTDLW